MSVKSGGDGGVLRSVFALLTAFALLFAVAGPSAAKPRFAALAVDARTGEVLFSSDADGLRHPASLTKVMTLYLLFQDLKAKRITMGSKIRFSRKAASQAPSKLGIKPGRVVTVDTAIRALVTKSANDVAVAVAETLGGSEAAFANRMTRTARAIGMGRTTFRNASGLPNPSQWTTARDMATLSLRIQRDFPQYYPYFALKTFAYNGRVMRTHNRLLGRYAGVDGIKTGYIRASGYNLTSSARRGDKRVVGVVLGAPSPGYRNRYMMALMDRAFPKCRNGNGIAMAAGFKGPPVTAEVSKPAETAAIAPETKSVVAETPDPELEKAAESVVAKTDDDLDTGEDTAETEVAAASPPTQGSAFETVEAEPEEPAAEPVPEALPFQVKAAATDNAGGRVIEPSGKLSWDIQIGAFPSKEAAESKLKVVRKKASRYLAGKPGFTQAVSQGNETIYRARFTGFTEKSARAACRRIAAKGFGCLTLAPQS
jgi:D-alanyl-D-alanine carboxypeptidase